MNALSLPGAPGWFDALLILSIQATLLAGIVWLIIKALGRWIPPNWRALLWFVVIARVLIPFAPPSSFSLQNIFVKPIEARAIAPHSPQFEINDNSREINFQTTHAVNSMVFPAPATALTKPPHHEINPANALAITWATGAMLLFGLLIARSLIIRHRLVRHGRAPDPKTLEAIAECRAELRLRFPIRATVSDRIAAPALTGLIPARLIVPTAFANGQFTQEQIRQILLHELAHIKQGHLVLHWLTLLARAVQWFNPAIHFAATRLRQECELAADAVALKNSTPGERAAYGETILQVLARSAAPPTLLAMGMADRARHLEQRLRALGETKRKSFRTIGVVVFATIAIAGLSGATAQAPSDPAKKTPQRIHYTLRVVECPAESIPRVAETLGLDERSTRPLGGTAFTNFVINSAQTKLLEKVRQLSGTDFLTSPGKDFEVGAPAKFDAYEDPEVSTNLPPNTWFSPQIEIASSSLAAGVLTIDSKLVLPTFLGYGSNVDTSGALLPGFRVRSTPAKQSLRLGGSIVFYVPPSPQARVSPRKKVPTLGELPTIGRLFRSEGVTMTNIARLVFLTPSLADTAGDSQPFGPSIFVPNSPMPVKTVAGVAVSPPFAPPTGTNVVALSYQQSLNLPPDKNSTPPNNLPAPSARLDTLREEQIRSSPAIEDARRLIEIGRFDEAEALLKNALEEDSNNRMARDYLNLIKLRRGGVSHAFSDTQTVDRFATNAPPSGLSRSMITRKLESIRFDEFPLDQETDLVDVLKQLGSEIRKRDPGGRGINLIIAQPPYRGSNTPAADTEQFKIKFERTVHDVTARQLFDAIVRVARPPDGTPSARLKYDIEDYAVVFRQEVEEQQLNPKTKTDAAAARREHDPGEGGDALISRSFRVDPNVFLKGLADDTAREGQITSLKTATNIDALQTAVRDFFVAAGAQFPTNNLAVGGAVPSRFGFAPAGEAQPAIFFNDRAGVLFVRAKESDLNIIENALHAFNARANPPRVRLDVRIFDSGPDVLPQALRPLFPIPPIPSDVLTNMTNFFLSPTIASKFIENAGRAGLRSVKDISSTTVAGRQVRIGDESVHALEPGDTEVMLDIIPVLGPGLSGLELSSVVTTTSRLPAATNETPRFRVNNRIIPNSGIAPGGSELICVPVRRSQRITVTVDAAAGSSVQEVLDGSRTWLILITPTMLEPTNTK